MSNNKTQLITLGGIIKHTNGLGFKVTCDDKDEANRIKDMLRWILQNDDKRNVIYNMGYYDKYNETGDIR